MQSSSEELTDEESEVAQVVSGQRVIDGSDGEDIDDQQDGDRMEDDDEGDPVVDAVAEEQDSDEHNDEYSEQGNDIDNEGDGDVIEAVVIQEDGDDPDSDGEDTVEVSVVEEVKAASAPKNKRKSSEVSKSPKKAKSSGDTSSTGRKKSSSKTNVVTTDSRNRRQGKKKKMYDPSDGKDKKAAKRDIAMAASQDPVAALYRRVPTRVVEVANDARTMLRESVPLLPFPVADTQIKVWGSLCVQLGNDVEGNDVIGIDSKLGRKFNTNCALYPIGFTCDRYEFSPVHGRVLKMRCSILDGKSLKSRLREFARSNDSSSTNTDDIHSKFVGLHDGPVFRVSWGPGVDDDVDKDSDHPYDPEIHSQPIFVSSKGKRRNDLVQSSKRIPPEKGMRVKVRFSKEQFCFGTIQSVNFTVGKDSTNKKNKTLPSDESMVSVRYDHGSVETFSYPDPDLNILLPGMDDEVGLNGEVELTEINGKAVASVVGESPLEAWGKALCRLGMIDEHMLRNALKGLEKSRQEAREKGNGKSKNKNSMSGQSRVEMSADDTSPDAVVTDGDRSTTVGDEDVLRKHVEELLAELDEAKSEDRACQVALANARIQDLGAFMCNPFYEDDTTKAQQLSWLAIAVRREKTRMGSTGNKKKIVTAFDLLERNNTFYNTDIESLVEGLPGSELCRPYVFQAFRGGTTPNRSWLQEVQPRNDTDSVREREKERDLERSERSKKAQQRARELQAMKDEQDMERELKKRKRDEIRDERKVQKQAEEDEKKKARVDERMSRLEMQVNERLYKEAAFQREKVILVMARSVSREFSRRRRAAELVAVQCMLDIRQKASSDLKPAQQIPLPMNGKLYDEDTVRVWDFISTFKSYFLQRGYMQQIPSLESLQNAITSIRNGSNANLDRYSESVSFLTDLAIALCKPLAASLTRILFASLIALNPGLQKEFGATFFNEVNAATAGPDEVSDNQSYPDVILPVNEMTWQEIARLAFLSDALSEMGYSRQEAAHLLRGYRSAGHPNSKESKRLRKAEDVSIAILRHKVVERREKDEKDLFSRNRIRIAVPSSPYSEGKAFEKHGKWSWDSIRARTSDSRVRVRMGLLKPLSITSTEYKTFVSTKEQYMEEALKLKEARERASTKEDDEDDDEEEEDDLLNNSKKAKSPEVQTANESLPTTIVAKSDDLHTSANTLDKNADTSQEAPELTKIGKVTPYDDFCGDIPSAPEVIRRCLAVLRALSMAESAEPFLYPVDPQTNPGYYDMVVRPMCFREAGKQLQKAAVTDSDDVDFLGEVVLQFGRNIRLIAHNCLAYSNAGPTVIAAGSEMLRIFERLILDWVLAPESLLPGLTDLDDEKCVDFHESDEDATQLFCDGCEGKYNISRLSPPLSEIPSGDWYCPRCISGRCYATLDPRLGKTVTQLPNITSTDTEAHALTGGCIVNSCFTYEQGIDSKPSILYEILTDNGQTEHWSLGEVDLALGDVSPIKWVQAVAESPGYSMGIDYGLRYDLVPVPLNPTISDASAQVAISSSVFRDTISAAAILLLIDPREMTAVEWLRLLVLLVMKCASGDVLQNVMSQMEGEAAESMLKPLEKVGQIFTFQDMLPGINEDLNGEVEDMSVESDNRSILPDTIVETCESGADNEGPIPSVVKLEDSQDDAMSPFAVKDMEKIAAEPVISSEMDHIYDVAEDRKPVKLSSFRTAVNEKATRQKLIEDSFVGYVVKNQIQVTVASFDEDMVSHAVDECLTIGDRGLQFTNLRCRQLKCHFCGLPDVALGLPFVRVPDEQEWDNLFAFASRSRRTHLVAELPTSAETDSPERRRLVSVRILVDGELASFGDRKLDVLQDGGMLEFLPRSEIGFQEDLRYRYEHKLPFIVGSLSAHECCAIAAHNGRKDSMIQKFKESQIHVVEKEAGMFCGRSLEIGRDRFGRSYWKFHSLVSTLFVCDETNVQQGSRSNYSATWHHFADEASVASVIVSLQRDPIVRDLLRAFPMSRKLVEDHSWPDILMNRRFPMVNVPVDDASKHSHGIEDHESVRDSTVNSFKVGDSVVVESTVEHLLWDAKVVGVSKRRGVATNEIAAIDAYRVEYKGWGNRFTEWVNTSRVLRQSEECKSIQDSRFHQRTTFKCGFPPAATQLFALDYLYAKDRSRSDLAVPDFSRILNLKTMSSSLKTFSLLKAMALAIEAALPLGSIDCSDFGIWSPVLAAQWRCLVASADGPETLMRCFFVLEDAIVPEWMKEDVGHLRSCLPDRWKAVLEASPASLAIRGILLDRSLKYNKVDRKKFANNKKTPKKK